jgi:hypothetical protein
LVAAASLRKRWLASLDPGIPGYQSHIALKCVQLLTKLDVPIIAELSRQFLEPLLGHVD